MQRLLINRYAVTTSLLVVMSVIANPSVATDRYTDQGRVLKVTPQYERVNTPRQTCHTEYREVVVRPKKSIGGSVIGGIAGGLLGSQIGKGSGKVAAAAIGAGIGAITGDRISRQNQAAAYTRQEPVEVCQVVDQWHREKVGYLVDYEYRGRQYSMVTNTHPGKYVDLDVRVSPTVSSVQQPDVYMTRYGNQQQWHKPKPHRHHF